MNKCFEIGIFVFIFILNLFSLVLGVIVAILIPRYRVEFIHDKFMDPVSDELQNGCNSIWNTVKYTQYLQIFEGIGIIMWYGLILAQGSMITRKWAWTGIAHFLTIESVVSIWHLCSYETMDRNCVDFWTLHAGPIWTIVFCQTVNAYLLIITVVFAVGIGHRLYCTSQDREIQIHVNPLQTKYDNNRHRTNHKPECVCNLDELQILRHE
jgi:hypothetical protein